MRFSYIPVLSGAVAIVVAGCADLALEPDQIPASMAITPADTLITEGDAAKLTVTVLDEDGNRIPGPPSWAPAEWTPNDPSKIDIAPDGSLIGLGGADLKVTAELAGLEAWTGLRINPNSVVFSAGAIYLTQGMQNVDGSVPIIAGRDAFLRLFGIGDEISFYKPRARAVFYQDFLWTRGIGQPVSVGRTDEGTYAHELGHNVGLRHAPCGSPAGADPDYPYDNGDIGVWGYDLRRSRLLNPEQYADLMGYCRPRWISDFSFLKAMDYRLNSEDDVLGSSVSDASPPEQTLMLWGSAGNGELLLEPAFMIDAVPTLPAAGGPYRLDGFDPNGVLQFSFDFTPDPVEFGGGHFQFAIPYDPELDGALERVVLSGPEGEFTLGRSSTPPMAIIRSRTSGQVRAILRDWSGGLSRVEGNIEIMVSDGLPGGGR
jgi:hypothetical protein